MANTSWSRGAQTTVPALIAERLDADPHGRFLDINESSWTAAEIFSAANRVANALLSFDTSPGERVAILMDNSPEAAIALYAATQCGAIAVPINTAHKGEYLRHQLADSGARTLVTEEGFADRVREIETGLPSLEHVVVTGAAGPSGSAQAWHAWDSVMTADDSAPSIAVAPSDTNLFIYTGGTTGPSKACVLSHNYTVALARQTSEMWSRSSDDVFWTPLPLFHFNAVALVLVGTLLVGGRAAISRKFSVSRFWGEIDRVGATMAGTLGSMVTLVANDVVRPHSPDSGVPEANRSLRFICGAPISPTIVETCARRFAIRPFDAAYGLTEGSLMAWLPPGMENKPNAAGIANDRYWDLRIFDDDDNEASTDTPGEIVGRPKMPDVMFNGYWGKPEATLEAVRNLWLHTGDIGRIDADGFLYFMDRKADYMRRRGENVSSQELEEVFLTHPEIEDVAVYSVPSPLGEDDIMVCVATKADLTLTEPDLFRWAIDRVPYFALPRYIELRDDLPRSPMGKVLKGQLRELGVTALTWDAEDSGISYEKR